MNDRFLSMQLFVRVARAGSFSLVARDTGISQPSVSRIVHVLEKRIGVSLLTRTTRAVTLTEAGADYLVRAESILAALDEADHVARGDGELRGVLRVAMSTSFAVRAVLPRLSSFVAPHPALRLDFVLTDERQDLVSGAIDAAIRIGPLTDSTGAVALKLGRMPRVLVASPSYLKQAGTPRRPEDLRKHAIIMGTASRGTDAWTFTKKGQSIAVDVEGRINVNGNEGVVAAAIAGLGIASSGLLGFHDDLAQGRLVKVLPAWDAGAADVHLILPAGRLAKPSARAFAEFMKVQFNGLMSTRKTAGRNASPLRRRP